MTYMTYSLLPYILHDSQTLVVRGFFSETLKHPWSPGHNIVPKVK